MTKEERALYMKAYRLANKDKRRAYNKAYNEANKDKKRAYNKVYNEKNKEYNRVRYLNNKEEAKAYYEANKEDILAKRPIYLEKTKEKRATQAKAYNESKKLPYNIVYCIPNYDGKGGNYCGVTNQPILRMGAHNTLGVLNTSEWYELGRCNDRKEAEALESAFHELGYHGAKGYKNKAA